MLLFFNKYKKQLEVALGALLGFLVSAVYIAQFRVWISVLLPSI